MKIKISVCLLIITLLLASCTQSTEISEAESIESAVSDTTSEPQKEDEYMQNLIAKWTFDNIDGGVVKDVAGGHDATVAGNPEIVTDGEHTGIRLAAVGDHLSVDDFADFNFGATDSFTLTATFKWSGNLVYNWGWPCIFNRGLSEGLQQYEYYGYWIDPSSQIFQFGTTNPSGGCRNLSADRPLSTEWHTAKIVQDGAKGTMKCYIDDVLLAESPAISADSTAGLFIGYNGADNEASQFLGIIDEIAVYNTAVKVYEQPKKLYKTTSDMEYHTYTYHSEILDTDIVYPYRVYYPTDYDINSDKKYPLLLFLHGHGETGTDNETQLTVGGGSVMLINNLIERDNCIIIAPQCQHAPVQVEGIGEYSPEWVSFGENWMQGARQDLPEIAGAGMYAVLDIMDIYLSDDKVDKDRIYVSGISMGGFGTWEIIAREPDMFAAAIPLCGGGIINSAEDIKDVAIWAFHGLNDDCVPVSGTQDMVEALQKVGGNIKATYFEGVGHAVWVNAYNTEGLIDWLLEQHK